jgi:hypothetical protein
MTDWRRAMRRATERDEQDHLSTDEAQAMRRTIVAAIGDDAPGRAASMWTRRPVLVAAAIVALISVGIATQVRLGLTNRPEHSTTELMPETAAIDATNMANVTTPSRQLQFVTAGGTRIIWVFNSDLDLKATLR